MADVVVVGAGPYGMAAAAHLRAVGLTAEVIGRPMAFWHDQMPSGMLLRSYWDASQISDPRHAWTLDAFRASDGPVSRPIPLERFVDYGRWFAERLAPGPQDRHVDCVEPIGKGFRITFSDRQTAEAERVVVAAGIGAFPRRPANLTDLPPQLATHSSEHQTFAPFAGRSVAVLGGGQSALESAALLHEAGASVEVIVRAPVVHWLRVGSGSKLHAVLHSQRNPLAPILFPSSDIGPPGINLLVDQPPLFKSVPTHELQARVARRAIRPAGAGWLGARLATVPITTGTAITSAVPHFDQLRLMLSDGSERRVDHLLLATGYAVDIRRYPFLSPELLASVRHKAGYPLLTRGCESSVSGLYFLGATAALSFGPLMRFVAGSGFAARSLTCGVLSPRPRWPRPRRTSPAAVLPR